MIIVLKPRISKKEERAVLNEIRKLGYTPHVMRGVARTVIGAIGDELTHANLETLASQFPHAVESVMPIQKRYKLVSREAHPGSLAGRIPDAIRDGRLEAAAQPIAAERSQFMLCGNPDMLKDAGAALAARGLRKNRRRTPGQITVESFW